MTVHTLVKPSEYHDSVALMLAARELTKLAGVLDAAVVMATEANKSLLRQAGLLSREAEAATPNDLVIAVSAADGDGPGLLAEAERLLRAAKPPAPAGAPGAAQPRTIRSAQKAAPAANVAVISVAGRYAADEAWDALLGGLHVLLFSDNVPLEDEIALKRYAREHGLLLMGPGAGTAVLNGVALGFANVLPAGPVGIVSAAGTGLQEVTSLLARHGVGVTQAIGTGGRDLKEAVGGLMMQAGLEALQADPATQVITLVGKPAAAAVVAPILAQVAHSAKPTVVCFLGGELPPAVAGSNVQPARTLQEAALLAARAAGADLPDYAQALAGEAARLRPVAAQWRAQFAPGQRYLRGLFSGGTLCYEAQVIWREQLPEPVCSNAPLDVAHQLADSTVSHGHTAVDLGEEEFTVGRPHPMIDNDLRLRRLIQEARDPAVAVVLLDVVLGYGAHPNPAAELGPGIRQARETAGQAGRKLSVVASVTGTHGDPQGLDDQVAALETAGAIVCSSNAEAARLAGWLVGG